MPRRQGGATALLLLLLLLCSASASATAPLLPLTTIAATSGAATSEAATSVATSAETSGQARGHPASYSGGDCSASHHRRPFALPLLWNLVFDSSNPQRTLQRNEWVGLRFRCFLSLKFYKLTAASVYTSSSVTFIAVSENQEEIRLIRQPTSRLSCVSNSSTLRHDHF